jgi:hypothetical protein
MTDPRTIEHLYKLKLVTDEQLDAAVIDFLNDPTPGARPLAEGILIDTCAIMAANPYAREVLAASDTSEAQMRMAVRTAILLARPASLAQELRLQPLARTGKAKRSRRRRSMNTRH